MCILVCLGSSVKVCLCPKNRENQPFNQNDVIKSCPGPKIAETNLFERIVIMHKLLTKNFNTCFRKLVIVFCISETKSWKLLIEGSVLFLEVTVTFTRLSIDSSAVLQT